MANTCCTSAQPQGPLDPAAGGDQQRVAARSANSTTHNNQRAHARVGDQALATEAEGRGKSISSEFPLLWKFSHRQFTLYRSLCCNLESGLFRDRPTTIGLGADWFHCFSLWLSQHGPHSRQWAGWLGKHDHSPPNPRQRKPHHLGQDKYIKEAGKGRRLSAHSLGLCCSCSSRPVPASGAGSVSARHQVRGPQSG
jgi:hypothetical protein